MKSKFVILIMLLISTVLFGQDAKNINSEEFTLQFYSVGLGSNMFTKQPVFRVIGKRFVYTKEQAWKNGDSLSNGKKDTICLGYFRPSSIDSIIGLVADYGDTSVYKSNPDILSGGVDILQIFFHQIQVKFELKNIHDPVVYKIVSILNTYITSEPDKISLFPEEWNLLKTDQ